MSTSHSHPDEAEIRALVDTLVRAIRGKDVALAMSVFAPDVVSFDLGPALRHGGGATFAERWRALFDVYRGSIDYDVRDFVVSTERDVAFSHSLNWTAGTTVAGLAVERWVRWTAGYRRVDGRWLIAHEHVSVPADVRSGRAVLEATP